MKLDLKKSILAIVLILGIEGVFVDSVSARRVRLNKVEEIVAKYPNVDRQGLLELNRRILEGDLETDITLGDIENFLFDLEKVSNFNRELFKDVYKGIKVIRFNFSSTNRALRLNTKDAELIIYPNSSLLEAIVKRDSKISALEEIGHLYTAPGVAIIEYPCLKSFIGVLKGEIEHPFIEGFNVNLDFSQYFKSYGGYFSDWSVIDSINEVINTKVLIDVHGDRYKRAILEENEVEFSEYKTVVEEKIAERNFGTLKGILPHIARFELIFSLSGEGDKATEVRIYAMRIIRKSPTSFAETYRSFYESLNNLTTSIELKEKFRRRLETESIQKLIEGLWF